MTKNNEVILDKPFQNSGITRRLWRFQHATVLERSIEVGFSLILSIYKVVCINIRDLHVGYVATRWRNLLSNLPKMRIWIGRNGKLSTKFESVSAVVECAISVNLQYT